MKAEKGGFDIVIEVVANVNLENDISLLNKNGTIVVRKMVYFEDNKLVVIFVGVISVLFASYFTTYINCLGVLFDNRNNPLQFRIILYYCPRSLVAMGRPP